MYANWQHFAPFTEEVEFPFIFSAHGNKMVVFAITMGFFLHTQEWLLK